MDTYDIQTEARTLAEDYLAELMNSVSDKDEARESVSEWAHETADGHQWVIYYHKALQVIAQNNTDAGEDWLEGIYDKPYDGCDTINDVHTRLAYAMMCGALEEALYELIEEFPGYAVGCHTAGYLPDHTPAGFETWEEAKDSLLELLEEEAEDAETGAEECREGAMETDCPESAAGLRKSIEIYTRRAEALRQAVANVGDTDAGEEFGITIGGVHYFLSLVS